MSTARRMVTATCLRTSATVAVYGAAVIVARPDDPSSCMIYLQLILRTDEKIGKILKSVADAKSAWTLLKKRASKLSKGLDQDTLSTSSTPLLPRLSKPSKDENSRVCKLRPLRSLPTKIFVRLNREMYRDFICSVGLLFRSWREGELLKIRSVADQYGERSKESMC